MFLVKRVACAVVEDLALLLEREFGQVRDFLRVYALSLFDMVCMWLGSLDMRERSSVNSMRVTIKFGVPVSVPFTPSAMLSMSFE